MTHRTSPRLSFLAAGLLLAAGSFALVAPLHATSFTVTSGPADTTAKTLASGQTGTVNSGGTLSINGGTTAVTVTGNATVTNSGTITQTGSGRAIDLNTNNVALTVTNNAGATIQTVNTDAIRVNQTNAGFTLNNSGTIAVTNGGQALDLAAITTGTNIVNNFAGGVISAVGEDAIRPGNGGVVNNAGSILATPIITAGDASGSDAIDLRTNRTVTVTNTGTITGRHGIATDGANSGPSSLTLNNNAGGVVSALNGSGVNIDGVSTSVTANVTNAFGATIKGGVLSTTTVGDGDGVDVDGVLTLNNSGDILGLGAKGLGSDGGANHAEAVSIGGGTIVNTATGRIVGSSLAADAANGDVTRGGNGILADDSSGGSAIAATAITNAGLIQGKTGFAIKLVGTQNDTIDNQAGGLIRGGKTAAAATYAAAIDTGGGNDTVTNAGSLLSDGGAAATAITLGAGNDQLTHSGGGAVVTGGMDGGTGTDRLQFNLGSPAATFTQNGAITNFEHLEIASGKVQLSGALSLGADTNTLAVQNAGILNLGDDVLSLDHGSAVVDGVMKFLLTSDSNYGQLFFAAGNLGGLTLTGTSGLDLDFGYTPLLGTQFTLVDFLGGSSFLAGTFAGLAEGAFFVQEGYQFQISYQGNAGHDIVITRTVPDTGATLAFLAGALGLLALARRRTLGGAR